MHERYDARAVMSEGNDIALVRLPQLAQTFNENGRVSVDATVQCNHNCAHLFSPQYLVMPLCLPWKRSSLMNPSDSTGEFFVSGWGKASQRFRDFGDLVFLKIDYHTILEKIIRLFPPMIQRGLGVFERQMRFAAVPIVPWNQCRRNNAISEVHPERHVCAGGEGGKDNLNLNFRFLVF